MKVTINPDRSDWPSLQRRATMDPGVIVARVESIIGQVRDNGDAALRELAKSIDGVELSSLRVSPAEIGDAEEMVDAGLKEAIDVAAANIRKFHSAQAHPEVDMETMPGVRCVQRSVPIQSVGLYIPAGSAPLFSTVLMLAIPAAVAGCPEITLCTPPNKAGRVTPEILYAASVCGVTSVFKVGGAQAVAAMAYGTETIPRVDKIFGPGNQYVTLAKQLLSTSQVAIDMPAGPSEVMVLADGGANPEFVAADMLSQAEHGDDSQAIVVTDSVAMAQNVADAVNRQVLKLDRQDTARKALVNSRIIALESKDDMIAFANEYAAEHLIISMDDPWSVAAEITAAGSIFIGNYTPESAGDYASGTNHTLPTYGWARSFSGVNLDSFVRKITIQELSTQGLQTLAPSIIKMALAEGLDAHAKAVEIRVNELKND